ncbi:MAG: hypothetical protein DRH08_01425 [Deltaproteobacteria bacterium]|nr:MAG: hypothetical protein DRH08_01425 [Deltaproteobacteria bacterium]
MNWTTAANLSNQVQKMWDKGLLLSELASGSSIFPKRLRLKGPTSTELVEHFTAVRDWISRIDRDAKHYRVVWRSINHRLLGSNAVPNEIWVDSLADALRWIGKGRDAERFRGLVALTAERQPQLTPWLQKRPLRALELADDWPLLLDIISWLESHARPGVYLRQVDIPGVHSKFIESHRAVLAELFDLVLPLDAIDTTARGVTGFCRRYGFRDKPSRLRFRVLDPDHALFSGGTDQDITLTMATFARLDMSIERVFITENEINFLAFPAVPHSIVIFGAGYGFDALAEAKWLQERNLYYWGDIDTHGFAILDQLRADFPAVVSFLMDRETLLAHQTSWGLEATPERRDLPQLNSEESKLYDDLRQNRLSNQLRLEQERIGFDWLEKWLDMLCENV